MPIGGSHVHQRPTLAIQLDGRGAAIKGVLRPVNGGTGNEHGLASGDIFESLVRGDVVGDVIPLGTVLVVPPSGILTRSPGEAATNVVGVVAELDGIAHMRTGLVQVAGVAEVRVTGTVYAGDRLVTSSTPGVAVASNSGVGQFARALSHSYGSNMVRALLTSGGGMPSSAIDHGGLSGLPDDDHGQYLLRNEVRLGPLPKSSNVTPTDAGLDSVVSGTLTNLTDGNPATAASVGGGVWGEGTFYSGVHLDLGVPTVLSALGYAVSSWASSAWDLPPWTRWRVRVSDDGTTWTTLDEGNVPTALSGVIGHRSAAARYWEWAWGIDTDPGLTAYSGFTWYTLDWYEFPSQTHRLFSDAHADVDLATAPTDGQALVWDAASGAWLPGDAGGGGAPPIGSAGGDLSGTYPDPNVAKVAGTAVAGTPGAAGKLLRSTGAAAATWATLSADDHPFHDEPLTDGASAFIFAGGDVVIVVGIPNV